LFLKLLITSKKKQFFISESGNIYNELNTWYTQNVFADQNDSEEYQDLLSRFSKVLAGLLDLIKEMNIDIITITTTINHYILLLPQYNYLKCQIVNL